MHRIFAAAFALLLLPFAALAADPAPVSARIDFSPLLNELLLPIIVALGGVLATWLTGHLKTWLKIQNDEKVRELIDVAIRNGIALAQSRLGDVRIGIDVKNQVIADSANYVIKAVPDALKRFGIDPQTLAEKIEARIAVKEQEPKVVVGELLSTAPAAGTAGGGA